VTKIGLRAYNPVEVDLGDKPYETIDLPHESSKRFQELMEEMSGIGETEEDEDRATGLLLEAFDLILKPAEENRTKASTVLKKGLDSGAITPRQFIALWTDVLDAVQQANGTQEVEGEVDRPT